MRPDPQLASLLGLSPAGGRAVRRVPAGRHERRAGQGHRGPDHPVPRRGRSLPRQRRHHGGHAVLGRGHAHRASRRHAAQRRHGGHAAAFVYDLARSVVYTHQGNPAWAATERDGSSPIRPNDLFFPDYVDLDRVAIPQADEQQRLLANIIHEMQIARRPLPRFWYLPSARKAVIVHALDDHNTGSGTRETFDKLDARSPSGCSVADWTCLRATSWGYTGHQPDRRAGRRLPGPRLRAGCARQHQLPGLDAGVAAGRLRQRPAGVLRRPSRPWRRSAPNRTHCIAWSDWATQPKVELARGIRYDMNYYYWPGSWIAGRPGLFTGSGIPMRFADLDGTRIDVYQAREPARQRERPCLSRRDRDHDRPRPGAGRLLRRASAPTTTIATPRSPTA